MMSDGRPGSADCELRRLPRAAEGDFTQAVRINSVCFQFGNQRTLQDCDVTVDRGVIYGLLGPSGCGKTTLLRCIVGRHLPSSGSIKIFGKNPGQRGCCVPGPGVGFMPQDLALYPEITTEETLQFFGRVYQMSEKDIKNRIDFLTKFLDIPDKTKLIKNLSGGQQRRVSFAIALLHKPPLVILDEPTVGVDPLLRKSIWNYLQRLATVDFITIIITTHYVEEARQADVVGFMRNGRLLAEANPEYLMKTYDASSLEDVFLKLCMKTDDEADSMFSPSDFCREERREDIWIMQKSQKDFYPTSNGSSEHKTSLLSIGSPDTPHQTSLMPPERGYFVSMATRMRGLIIKNLIRQKRCIPLIFFQLFVPAFQVIVFCLCIGGEPHDLPLAIVNSESDPSGKSGLFLEHLNPQTIRQVPFTNLTPAIESVIRGENWGVMHIPTTFTDSMINRYLEGLQADNETIVKSTIVLYLDMTNKMISMTLYARVMENFQQFSENVLKMFYQNPLLAQPPIVLGTPVYGHETPDFSEFMAPGMVLGITYIMAVGLSSMSVILEKKQGLLDRSCIAGVRTWEVLFSILVTLFVVMLFQVALVLLLTFLAFNLQCLGNLVWVIIAVLLVGLEGMSYGLFISSICNDENIAVMIALGSFYPTIILSGIIWPVEAMPHYLQKVSSFLPLTLVSNTVRCILSRGWSLMDHGIWVGFLVALGWIVPVILISSIFFKYKK